MFHYIYFILYLYFFDNLLFFISVFGFVIIAGMYNYLLSLPTLYSLSSGVPQVVMLPGWETQTFISEGFGPLVALPGLSRQSFPLT